MPGFLHPLALPFCNNWYYTPDPQALESLEAHGKKITFLIPFWFGVTGQGTLEDQSDEEALILVRRFKLPVLAIVHNYSSPRFGPLIHRLLTDENLRRTLVASIREMLLRRGFAGVNIDFEFVPPEDRPFLTRFQTELFQALKPLDFLVTISVPAELEDNPRHPFSGAFSYPDLAEVSDQMYVLAYDEHFAEPGPIASLGFVEQVMNYALTAIPREKIFWGLPVYGYDWAPGARVPETLSYAEAIARAQRFGAQIRYDEQAQESTYTYVENGVRHIVWFEDAKSFQVKLNLIVKKRLPGIGVWRLGLEDPKIWDLLEKSWYFEHPAFAPR
ncbi:MAG: glycosyl hydrolase family 18 protein [Bacillota bacterium]